MNSITSNKVTDRVQSLVEKYKTSVDYLEIRLEEREKEFVSFNKEGIRNIGSLEREGGCVRTCHNGGWGFISFTTFAELPHLIERAIQISKSIGDKQTVLSPVKPVIDRVYPKILEDPRSISLDDKLTIFAQYTETLQRALSDRIKAFSLSYTQDFTTRCYFNSEGSHLEQQFLSMDVMLAAIAFFNGSQTTSHKVLNSARDFGIFRHLDNEVEKVISLANEFSDAPPMKGGKLPVILDPEMGGTFAHESFGHTSEADLFASSPGGRDILKIGKRFGRDILNIYDTGSMTDFSGSMKYDDEGVPTEKTELITDGILSGRLHTRQTAAEFGEKVTGSARAMNFQYPPIVRMRNTCIGAGEGTLDNLLSGIKEGLFAEGLMGGHGGENFSFIPARGYMIRDGKLCEPVKNFVLSGNLFESLLDIDAISGKKDFSTMAASGDSGGCGKLEQFPLPVGMSSPYIRFQKMNIGGC